MKILVEETRLPPNSLYNIRVGDVVKTTFGLIGIVVQVKPDDHSFSVFPFSDSAMNVQQVFEREFKCKASGVQVNIEWEPTDA